jgi:DNA-directed RNA polymerase specialized sigma24 family protein
MMEAVNFRYGLNVTQAQRREPMDMSTTFRLHTSENIRMSNDQLQQSAVFNARFSRCHEMLLFLAFRVLGSPERADDVVENCRITASRNPPTFEHEGAFRSWLVRILIAEALVIVRQREDDVIKVGLNPGPGDKYWSPDQEIGFCSQGPRIG